MHNVPKAAEWLLRRLVPGREGEIIAGDLLEQFETRGGGRIWYWAQVLSCVAVRLSPHRLTVPGLGQDFHFAFRMLRRNPGYAITAMLCLALGIGVNTTVYTLVDELFFKRLPVPDAGRVVMVERAGGEMTSYRDYQDLMRRTSTGGRKIFSALAGFDDAPTSLDTEGVSQMIMAQAVTANFANTLGLKAQIGRWFVPEDDAPGSEPVAVLSDHAWTRRFGRSPDAIGQRVRIETQWYRLVGIAPPDFIGVSPPHGAEIWIPFTAQPYVRPLLLLPAERQRPSVRLIGRLAPGVRLQAAEAEVRNIDGQIWREFPRDRPLPGQLSVAVASGVGVPNARAMVFHLAALLSIVTAVVLMIACANVANLLLSRSAVRRREMAVRQALGASRWRLARQTLTESLTLAAGGAALGLLLAVWTNRLLVRTMPTIPHLDFVTVSMSLNWRVIAFSVAAAFASTALFSLSPAIEQSKVDLTPALKNESDGLGRMRQRDVYVVAQVALSLVLLITATLLVRALRRAGDIDPGFAMSHRLAARIYISEPEYTPETGRLFFARMLEQVRATPGVRGATLSYTIPLNFSSNSCITTNRTEKPKRVLSNIVTPGYLNTMEIPLMGGRDFSAADQPGSPRVVIVNQTLARRYWPSESALGKRLWLGCNPKRQGDAVEVIGVARDAKYGSLDEEPRPFIYSAFTQGWVGFMALTVHTMGDPAEFAVPLRSVLQGLDPHLRIYEMSTLEAMTAQSLWQVRWQAGLLGGLGLLAIVLASVGLYGVVAYSVAQRTREIGVRMAMGAQKADVLWMVLGRGLRLTIIGVGIGVALSAVVTRFLGSFLYGLSPLDPASFIAAALFWIGTAMIASYVPARRAARVDPIVALRWE